MKPVIGLGALFLDPGVSGGSETYLRELAPRLVAAHPEMRFELATTRRGAAALRSEPWVDDLALLALPCDDDEMLRRSLVEQGGIPRLARRRGWSMVHTLSNRGPALSPVPSVVSVLDVIFFEHRTLSALSTAGMRASVALAARHAKRVITISEASAESLARILGTPRERIDVIPLGPGRDRAAAPDEPASVRARHGIAPAARVVLCVAAKRPHKNQASLVRALAALPDDVVAVCVGHDEGYGTHLRDVAAQLGVDGRLHLLEGVSDAELEGLWATAAVACLPTLAEGFGLPVLEAMRRGVPVACSDLPVLHEVAGDAAVYFDPHDPGAAAAAIVEAAGDRSLADRGADRARSFSWDETARRTFAVYERVLEAR